MSTGKVPLRKVQCTLTALPVYFPRPLRAMSGLSPGCEIERERVIHFQRQCGNLDTASIGYQGLTELYTACLGHLFREVLIAEVVTLS